MARWNRDEFIPRPMDLGHPKIGSGVESFVGSGVQSVKAYSYINLF